jgi:hypothetical protein
MKRIMMGVVVFFCGSLLVLVLGFTGSQAKTVPPAVKVLSISAPAFEMPNESLGYINNGRIWLTKKGEYVRAPLILPNGSKITKVELVGKDAHASKDLILYVHAYNNTCTKSAPIAWVHSSGSDAAVRTFATTAISPATIDNLNNFYFLNLLIPEKGDSFFIVSGAKIYYTGTW